MFERGRNKSRALSSLIHRHGYIPVSPSFPGLEESLADCLTQRTRPHTPLGRCSPPRCRMLLPDQYVRRHISTKVQVEVRTRTKTGNGMGSVWHLARRCSLALVREAPADSSGLPSSCSLSHKSLQASHSRAQIQHHPSFMCAVNQAYRSECQGRKNIKNRPMEER